MKTYDGPTPTQGTNGMMHAVLYPQLNRRWWRWFTQVIRRMLR
jgi:hypothetical protein